jgi:hypothetical protein
MLQSNKPLKDRIEELAEIHYGNVENIVALVQIAHKMYKALMLIYYDLALCSLVNLMKDPQLMRKSGSAAFVLIPLNRYPETHPTILCRL